MNARMQNRYLADSVTTASPGVLLVRLYDRLLRDLHQAEQAIVEHDVPSANENLLHAQAIVSELHDTLRVDVWAGGPALAQVYEYAHAELVQANVHKDADRVAGIRELFSPLRDAWAEAAAAPVDTPEAVSA